MSLYDAFYREVGVRTPQQLVNPKTAPINTLTLPRDSIIHYLPTTSTDMGIDARDPLLLNHDSEVFIHHIEALKSELGTPRLNRGAYKQHVQNYHKRFRKHRLLRRLASGLRDPRSLIVSNYASLTSVYQYRQHALATYYRYYNLHTTLYAEIIALAKETDRQHFIPVTLPKVLPERDDLDRAIGKVKPGDMPRSLLTQFKENAALTYLDLYLWLSGEAGVTSLSHTPVEVLKRINLVFIESGQFSVLSLSHLVEWMETDNDLNDKLRRFYMAMFEKRTVMAESEADDEVDNAIAGVPVVPPIAERRTQAIVSQADELADAGILSGAEYRRMVKLADQFTRIPNPYGEGTLEQLAAPDTAVTMSQPKDTLPEIKGVVDKSMLNTTVNAFHREYIKNVMPKDIAAMTLGIQQAGVAVTDYQVQRVVDAVDKYDMYTVKLTPVKGQPSTIRFKLPVVEEDGTFLAGGVKVRYRTQRADVPLRKTSASTVALTSYYGKTFVERSGKVVNDYGKWLVKHLTQMTLADNSPLSKVAFADVMVTDVVLPRGYTAIAKEIRTFTFKEVLFTWDYPNRGEVLGINDLSAYEQDNQVVIGKQGKYVYTMDRSEMVYRHHNDSMQPIGELYEVINITDSQPPIEMASVKVFSKHIPVGVVLAFKLGIDKLIKRLGVEVKRVPVGTRVQLAPQEYKIVFADETLVVSRADREASLILGGFVSYKNAIKQYNLEDFNHPDVYFNVINEQGLSARFIQEMELMDTMFVDPITEEILTEMGEPTTFEGLLFRSVELVATDQHPKEMDSAFMRLRGYERFSGTVYKQMVEALREYRAKPMLSKASINLNPKAVWLNVLQDESTELVETSNPVHNLKEHETLTFAGQGGRSTKTMVRRSRMFHKNDLGVISESTPDSAKVAITTYLTPDAKIRNLRGMTDSYTEGDGPAKYVSSVSLLSPGADRDSSKRTNMTSVQHSSGIQAVGYTSTPVRTGYEKVMAHRVDDLFAYTAKQDGKITDKDDRTVTITYKDGTEVTKPIGTQYAKVADGSAKHVLKCDLEVGRSVKAGDVITYNDAFFEPDFFDPKQVSYKAGAMAKVVLMETSDTLEDGSAISPRLSKALATPTVKTRAILVRFDQQVINLVKVGDTLEADGILCTIEDGLTDDGALFDEETLASLQALAANNPKAKLKGEVENIEVLYNGDKSDMSPTLQTIANRSDRQRSQLAKQYKDGRATNGRVTEPVIIEKQRIELDHALIIVTLSTLASHEAGDKLVLGNNLKSVTSRVLQGTHETKSGTPIDMIFAYQSISNRIALATEIIGTTNTVLGVISKQALALYEGE